MAQTFLNLAQGVTGTLPTSNYVQGGITEADQWLVSSSFSATTNPIVNNWERVGLVGFSKIGTGMSQSSGIFTFPSTGIYKIFVVCSAFKSGDDRTISKRIFVTTNNSSYTEVAMADTSVSQVQSNNTHTSGSNTIYFDVTDTANCKVKFGFFTNNSSTYYTSNTVLLSNVMFIRMGDT